ncbi:hypothetical protein LIHA111178_02510 [Litorimonas haliclonae]
MNKSCLHILSRKTIRGAASAVASFSVLNGALAGADEAERTTSFGAYSVDSASDTLAAILKDAQEQGFVRTKTSDTEKVQEAKPVETQPEGDAFETEKEAETDLAVETAVKTTVPFSCNVADILDFSDLEDVKNYDALSDAKANYRADGEGGKALNLARHYIALGLGDEAMEVLASDVSAKGVALKQVAKLVAFPEVRPKNEVVSDYKNCSQIGFLWAFLERPEQLPDPLSMPEIRDMLYAIDDFPEVLKGQLLVTIAIVAAENNQNVFADHIWRKLENRARENGNALPQNRTSDFDYLYLSALLEKSANPAQATAKFKYLSERGSVYRPNAVSYIAEIKSRDGEKLSKTLEADLRDVSTQLKETSGGQDAAFELVKGQLEQGRISDSIQSTQSFLKTGSPEYKLAQAEIVAALTENFESESQAVQSTALDTFLRETDFLKSVQTWESLKLSALKASLKLGLPELVTAIQSNGEAVNADQRQSLEKARVLLSLKTKTYGASEYQASSPLNLKGLEPEILDYALMHSDMALAKLALNDLTEHDRKSSYEMNVAWLEQNWSKAQDLSERINSKVISEVNSEKQGSETVPPKTRGDASILQVLSKPALGAPALTGAKWRATLSSQLSDLDEQIKISRAFLNHG